MFYTLKIFVTYDDLVSHNDMVEILLSVHHGTTTTSENEKQISQLLIDHGNVFSFGIFAKVAKDRSHSVLIIE